MRFAALDLRPILDPRRARSSRLNTPAWACLRLMLVGLMLTGIPLHPVARGAEPDPVVARVNDHEIRLSAVYESIESLPLGDQIDVRDQLERFIDSVVREEVLFQFVLASDFKGAPELRARMKQEILDHLITTQITERIQINDDDISRYYEENLELLSHAHVRASQIVMASNAECAEMRRKIKTEAMFQVQARSRSLHRATAERGGDMGYFMNIKGPLGFEDQLFDMTTGEMRIFQAEDGCRLVRLTERDDPPVPPLEEVQEGIIQALTRQQEARLLLDLLDRASRAVKVERFEIPAGQ